MTAVRPDSTSATWSSRARVPAAAEDPLYHDFPKQLDNVILKSKPTIAKDGYRVYRASGSINNTVGNYEIGIFDGKITHRFFKPIK